MREILAPLIIGGVVMMSYGETAKQRPMFLVGLWLFVGGAFLMALGARRPRLGKADERVTAGLDWEWTRSEFRKALLDCEKASRTIGTEEGLELVGELHACALLMLNFRDRLMSTQLQDLSDLAGECDFNAYHASELRDDPGWDDSVARDFVENAIKFVRATRRHFDGI